MNIVRDMKLTISMDKILNIKQIPSYSLNILSAVFTDACMRLKHYSIDQGATYIKT